MRFSVEHGFPGPPGRVAAILGDPDFYRDLELPDLRLLDVRDLPPVASRTLQRPAPDAQHGLLLRYEFTGTLDPVALRLLGGARLTWTQEVHVRGETGGWIRFSAEANPRLLHGRADYALGPGEEGTVRRLHGELVVAVPVVGGMAERRILTGVLHRLEVEAGALRERLGSA